jgi:hypothetical protein
VNIKYPVEELAPGGHGRSLGANTIAGLNVTSLELEIPTACLTSGSETVIGGWTTASIRQAAIQNPVPQSDKSVASVGAVTKPTGADLRGGPWVQVSPLVNELVIGLPDKDRFNASRPKDDAQFADYVTNPSLPILLQVLFGSAGVTAPNVYPRSDLVAAFLTGVSGLNQPANVKAAEELRLNTAIPVTPIAMQKDLGVLAGDTSGFPNGRPSMMWLISSYGSPWVCSSHRSMAAPPILTRRRMRHASFTTPTVRCPILMTTWQLSLTSTRHWRALPPARLTKRRTARESQ